MTRNTALAEVGQCKPGARKAGCDAILLEDSDKYGMDLNPGAYKQRGLVVIKESNSSIPPLVPTKRTRATVSIFT